MVRKPLTLFRCIFPGLTIGMGLNETKSRLGKQFPCFDFFLLERSVALKVNFIESLILLYLKYREDKNCLEISEVQRILKSKFILFYVERIPFFEFLYQKNYWVSLSLLPKRHKTETRLLGHLATIS